MHPRPRLSAAHLHALRCEFASFWAVRRRGLIMDATIDTTPLLKLLLHAAKYPALPINGLLLGRASPNDGDSASVQIVDAVPVFHGQLHLSMPMETALLQASVLACHI